MLEWDHGSRYTMLVAVCKEEEIRKGEEPDADGRRVQWHGDDKL